MSPPPADEVVLVTWGNQWRTQVGLGEAPVMKSAAMTTTFSTATRPLFHRILIISLLFFLVANRHLRLPGWL